MKTNEKIKYLRETRHMQQDELARLLNIKTDELISIELGQAKCDIDFLKVISRVFAVSIDFLVDDDKTFDDLKSPITSINDEELNRLKLALIKNDIAKFKENLRPRMWENFPFFGAIAYMARVQIKAMGITYGTLRQQIAKNTLIFMFSFLIYFYAAFMIITPWFIYWQFNDALKRTEILVQNTYSNDLNKL